MSDIVVLGPTGNTGSALLRMCLEHGRSVRTGNRQDFDFFRTETYAPLFEGAASLFLMVPISENIVELTSALVKAAQKTRVSRVVKLSAYGASVNSSSRILRWHAEADQIVEHSGIPWSILRPNAFMQNFIQFYGKAIKLKGILALPAAEARVSFIDATDVAKVCYRALFDEALTGKKLELTGLEAIGFAQAAKILSYVLNKKVEYVDIPETHALEGMRNAGQPEWRCEALLELYSLYRNDRASAATDNFQKITGESPNTLHSFFMLNRREWK